MACLLADYFLASIFRAASHVGRFVVVGISNGLLLEQFGVVLAAMTIVYTRTNWVVCSTGPLHHVGDHNDW